MREQEAAHRRRGQAAGASASSGPSSRAARPRTPPPRRSAASPALLRAAADRREGLARLHGQVHALRSRARAADEEIGRLTSARQDAVARAARSQRDYTALETRVAGLDAGEEGLDAEHEAAVAGLEDVEDRLAKAEAEARAADRDRSSLAARLTRWRWACPQGRRRRPAAASDEVPGLLGSVAALLSVRPGLETAVAGALGPAADAVAVADPTPRSPRCGTCAPGPRPRRAAARRRGVPRRGPAACAAPGRARRPRRRGGPDALAAPWPPARPHRRRRRPRRRARAGRARARGGRRDPPGRRPRRRPADGGSASQPSLLEIQAAVDEARPSSRESTAAAERLGFDTARLERERLEAQQRVDVALARLHESDATLAAVAEELGQHGTRARSAPRRGRAARPRPRRRRVRPRAGPRRPGGARGPRLRGRRARRPADEPGTHERERPTEAARPHARPRPTPGWPCARARSAPGPCTAGPTPWPARHVRSARAGPAPRSAASGSSARAAPPRP